MARIHRLPVAVVNRIAAGEVVERPASVVKELLENALDAEPTRVDIALEQGGIALVRVVDDGHGIEPDDLPLAVAAHATSKLRVAEDLERIGTLGFRGEALASIGEVSRLVVRSRQRSAAGGTAAGASITVDGGHVGAVLAEACAPGTTVEVHQLFGNVPARRAFLRTPQTEWSHAAEAFVRTALAHPRIAFTLSHNGRRIHDLPVATDWRRRITDCFGGGLGDRLLEVEADDGEITVSGLVGHPQDDMASGRLQHLFVAGRPFRDRALVHAVQEGYRGLLLSGRHPVVFLRLDMPPELVDVNVHPAKMEVRFREPQRLYRLVLAALRTRFLQADLGTRLTPPSDPVPARDGPAPSQPPAPVVVPATGPRMPTARDLWTTTAGGPGVGEHAGRTAADAPAWESPAPASRPGPPRRAVQMHDRYIVVECGDGIEVIDQHALHERVLYERLRTAVGAGGLEVQRLLVPERVELDPAGLELVGTHVDVLRRAGLEIEPFGGTSAIVTGKPALVGRTPARDIVGEVLERLAAAGGGDPALLVDEVLHGLACRAAIKAGDALSQTEVDALVRDREDVPESHHCPHGRPTSLTLSRRDLDRQFRRT